MLLFLRSLGSPCVVVCLLAGAFLGPNFIILCEFYAHDVYCLLEVISEEKYERALVALRVEAVKMSTAVKASFSNLVPVLCLWSVSVIRLEMVVLTSFPASSH